MLILRLAAVMLAGVSCTYAVGLMLSQTWERASFAWTLLPLWISAIPLVFLLVALTVLFQRLRDRNAWVMALMFCGFMSLFAPQAAGGSPVIPGFMMAYRMTLLMMAPGLFAFFFLVFPARSRLDERAPGVKWRGAERRPDVARRARHAAGCAGRRCEGGRSMPTVDLPLRSGADAARRATRREARAGTQVPLAVSPRRRLAEAGRTSAIVG